jgi:hypothetical protein
VQAAAYAAVCIVLQRHDLKRDESGSDKSIRRLIPDHAAMASDRLTFDCEILLPACAGPAAALSGW